MHPNVGVVWLSIASAHAHTAAEVCVPIGGLLPGTRPPLPCWQKETYGLLLATDKHLSYVLLACPAMKAAFHSGDHKGIKHLSQVLALSASFAFPLPKQAF